MKKITRLHLGGFVALSYLLFSFIFELDLFEALH